MVHTRSSLGQRIVEAARLALIVHLGQTRSYQTPRQTGVIGGADLSFSKDGTLHAVDDRRPRSLFDARGEAA